MNVIGSIASLPYVVLFFAVWILSSLVRPFFCAFLVCLLLQPAASKRKFELIVTTFRYMILCNDKKWKETEQPTYSSIDRVERKTVIFVRHGESLWNETFNKGDRSALTFAKEFIPGVIRAVSTELYMMMSGRANDSHFYDSPLSEKGIQQALGIQNFLKTTKLEYSTPKEAAMIRLMLGESKAPSGEAGDSGVEQNIDVPAAQLISSNLRRAIATLVIGFKNRIDKDLEGDSVLILPQLQEISRNPDALSITLPQGKVGRSWADPQYLEPIYEKRIDTSLHDGNKPVNTNGLLRMQSFCEVIFSDSVKKDSVVCAGHSLWFRSFFREYLPRDFEHVSKAKKLQNGGCVGFILEKKITDKGHFFQIDQKSIIVIYGGF